MLYIASYGIALGLLITLFWLPGHGLLRLAGLRQGDPFDRLGELCLGLGFWIFGLFALAALGQLHRPGAVALLILAGALVWAGRRSREGVPGELQKEAELASCRPGLARSDLLPAAFLLAFLTPFFLLAASPQISWDAAVYHLNLPRLYLAAGSFRPLPMQVYSNWPLGTELLFALAMLIKDYILAKLVHFAFGLGILYTLLLAGRRAGRPSVGWLAGLLFLANPVVIFELRVAYVDLAHGFFLTVSLLFMHRALGQKEGREHAASLLLAGLAAGLMTSLKITGLIGAAAVGALYLPRLLHSLKNGLAAPTLRPFLIRFALPCCLLPLPWLGKAAWATGNPFYPFLGGLLPTPDWNAELGHRFATWQSSIGMGRELLDYLLLPLRVILQGGPGYPNFDGQLASFWILLLPLSLVFARRIPLARHSLAVAGLYFCAWAISSQQMRFLIPILPALALAAALSLEAMLAHLRQSLRGGLRWGLWLAAALLLLTPNLSYLHSGASLFKVYASERDKVKTRVTPPVFDFINQQLPEDAKLLMLNTNRAFFCQREYLADSFFEASQIAAWLGEAGEEGSHDLVRLRRKLASRGITHLLLEKRNWRIPYPESLNLLLQDPTAAHLLFRSEDGLYFLWELR